MLETASPAPVPEHPLHDGKQQPEPLAHGREGAGQGYGAHGGGVRDGEHHLDVVIAKRVDHPHLGAAGVIGHGQRVTVRLEGSHGHERGPFDRVAAGAVDQRTLIERPACAAPPVDQREVVAAGVADQMDRVMAQMEHGLPAFCNRFAAER